MFKKIVAAVWVLTFLFIPAVAAQDLDEGEQETVDEVGESLQEEEQEFGPYADEGAHYEDIDMITYDEMEEMEEDEGSSWNPVEIVGNYVSGVKDDISGNASDMLASGFMFLVDSIWQFNITMTEAMLNILNISMGNQIIDMLIGLAGNMVSDISGISGNGVQDGSGIFGTLVPILSVIVVAYMIYKFFVKRSSLSGLQAAVSPVLILTFSIFFITNMGYVLTTLNNMANEVTDVVSTSTSEDTETLSDSIHEMFVHRPYLYMQFDNANSDDIGQESIETILLNNQNDEEKRAEIQEQYADGNTMMTAGNVDKRFVYSGIFLIVNTFLSIPIWILAALFLGLQLLFIVVAALSPFYLIFSILPGQFGVFVNYLKLLLMPIAFQVLLGFLAMVIFTLSNIVYSIPGTEGLTGYFVAAFVQAVILFMAFIFRKQLLGVFHTSTGFVRQMFESERVVKTPVDKTKSGVGTAVKTASTVAGGSIGGPQGAVAGYQAGSMADSAISGSGDSTYLIDGNSQGTDSQSVEPEGNTNVLVNASTNDNANDNVKDSGNVNDNVNENVDITYWNEESGGNEEAQNKEETQNNEIRSEQSNEGKGKDVSWSAAPREMPLVKSEEIPSRESQEPEEKGDMNVAPGDTAPYTAVNENNSQEYPSIDDYESREKKKRDVDSE